jgi:protein SCO1/2
VRPPRHPLAKALTVAVCSILAAVILAACGASKGTPGAAIETRAEGPGPSGFAGAALPPERAHDFTLADQFGRRASTLEYRGRVVVLAFLDTRCGAPCVVIAQQIRGALDQLAASVPVLLVSIDPAADSNASIARYLARVSLSGRARYLTGSHTSLAAVWRAYRVPAASGAGAAFDRFAPVVVLDREGRARVAYPLEGLTPESLAHDIRALSR